ncbi:TPA: TetR/AcrR family transcriptional regulator [Pseudomonas aeruginosa]|nr:TetR/AcrR family transcriptional regulator [Pseudomonas aeruginosa]HEK0151678.1 TetR/AcrR family transcriptional regulator [Pseudomonas aeruginosa]HEK0165628.1 TetR/AcrR family transcriptional regulator [Pseudomonas aeruginosa]
MIKLTRHNWIAAGLDTLDQEGYAKVSSERIARRLNVTRGSFYHHFRNRNDFLEALLSAWEEDYNGRMLGYAAQGRTAGEVLRRYLRIAAEKEPQREIEIRAWALRDPVVARFQERVDAARLQFAIETAKRIAPKANHSEVIGKFAHMCLVGGQHSGIRHNIKAFNGLMESALGLIHSVDKIRNYHKSV